MSQLPAEAGFGNPNGILSQSPGLRGTSRSRSETLCLLFRFPLGHRPTKHPNRNAVVAIPSRLSITSATTPLALFPFPNRTQGRRWRVNLGLAADVPLGHFPVGIVSTFRTVTQDSPFFATSG